MSGLPVTQKHYNQTVLISELISLVKKAETNGEITDVHFKPFVKGYDISFRKNEAEMRVSVKCRMASEGYIMKVFENSRQMYRSVVETKADISSCIAKITQ